MKKPLLIVMAVVVLGAWLAGSTDANAYACFTRNVGAGETVRLRFDSATSFWLQPMVLTVREFNEFAEPTYYDSLCGIARLLVAGSTLSPGGLADGQLLALSSAFLKPGSRLQLSEFTYSGYGSLPHCSEITSPDDTCHMNGFIYRTATVLNR